MQDKNLLILRHGQAANGLRDIERPLTKRGRNDVQKMGGWMRQQGLQPEMVIASSAQRTTETARLCCAAAGVDEERVRCELSLYQADCDGWLAELAEIPDDVGTVLLIGHNPTLSWLVSQLSGTSMMMSTANLAHLTVGDGGWGEAMHLQQLIRPKDIIVD